jgi:hypothetical protein
MNYSFPNINKEYKICNICILCVLACLICFPIFISCETDLTDEKKVCLKCFVKERTGEECVTCGISRSLNALYRSGIRESKIYHSSGVSFFITLCAEFVLRFFVIFMHRNWVPFFDMLQIITAGFLWRFVFLPLKI